MLKRQPLFEFAILNKRFAEIADECGADIFVDCEADLTCLSDAFNNNYKIKALYLDEAQYSSYPYWVLSIDNKACLMYEINEGDIFIWVCYTEEEYRKSGQMTKLFEYLKGIHSDKYITIDTDKEYLKNLALRFEIAVFR
ncbi:hypothetical protein [Shewanella algae]|uniref:hypothetical protein n=1 Tax=Shewanella algae TaxID=38313 RepID=UPI003005BBB3